MKIYEGVYKNYRIKEKTYSDESKRYLVQWQYKRFSCFWFTKTLISDYSDFNSAESKIKCLIQDEKRNKFIKSKIL